MPAMITPSASNAAVVAAQRIRAAFLHGLEFPRQCRIAESIKEVHDRDAHSMFHFTRTKIVQERSPLLVFFQIFGDVFGEKNVPGVPAAHHAVR